MTSLVSSTFVQPCFIPKRRLVFFPSPYPKKHHCRSRTVMFNGQELWLRRNSGAFFTANVGLHQQIHTQEDDAPSVLLIDSIGHCLYSFVPGGELQFEYLGEALRTVDTIERLGIQRFFKQQIKLILESLYRWFNEQRFENLQFPKLGILNIYFALAMSMFEPRFSQCRLAFCKAYIILSILDELHDNTAHRRGLNSFQEAFQRWDASLVENHHPHSAVFKSSRIFLLEMASLGSKAQGRDLSPYMKETWEDAIAAYNKDIEWNLSGYFPTFDEYIKNATTTYGVCAVLSSITLFLTGEKISNNAFQLISKNSRLLCLASLIGRLSNDLMTYEREAKEGQAFNAIACYMKDNERTEREAIEAIKKMRKDVFRELELELFSCRGIVPEPCIRILLASVQQSCIIYRMVDSFRLTTDTEFQELVADYMGY